MQLTAGRTKVPYSTMLFPSTRLLSRGANRDRPKAAEVIRPAGAHPRVSEIISGNRATHEQFRGPGWELVGKCT